MDKAWTRNVAICGAALAWLGVPSAVEAAASDAAATQLFTKYNCQACHTVDKKLVAQAIKDLGVDPEKTHPICV